MCAEEIGWDRDLYIEAGGCTCLAKERRGKTVCMRDEAECSVLAENVGNALEDLGRQRSPVSVMREILALCMYHLRNLITSALSLLNIPFTTVITSNLKACSPKIARLLIILEEPIG